MGYDVAGKQRIAKQTNETTTDYLTDQGHSVIHLVQTNKDNQPIIIASYVYSPYGIETTINQDKKTKTQKLFGFDGQLTDPHTGWQFLGKGYRAYNPLLHRFMSQDSLSPFDKGGINGYVFAGNNPIMQFDPSGHMPHWLSYIIPQNIAGWVGFGVAIAVGFFGSQVIGMMAGSALSGAEGIAAAGGIGGISNAAGQYVGHGIDSHHWGMDWNEGGQLATSFDVGVGLGAITAGITVGLVKGGQAIFKPEHESLLNTSQVVNAKQELVNNKSILVDKPVVDEPVVYEAVDEPVLDEPVDEEHFKRYYIEQWLASLDYETDPVTLVMKGNALLPN